MKRRTFRKTVTASGARIIGTVRLQGAVAAQSSGQARERLLCEQSAAASRCFPLAAAVSLETDGDLGAETPAGCHAVPGPVQ